MLAVLRILQAKTRVAQNVQGRCFQRPWRILHAKTQFGAQFVQALIESHRIPAQIG